MDEQQQVEARTFSEDDHGSTTSQPLQQSKITEHKGKDDMMDVFEQSKKMTEITWEGWKGLLDDGSLLREMEQRFFTRCVPWISVMRGAYNVNATAWNTYAGQCREIFFRMLRQSPIHDDQRENQWRTSWETVQKAQQVQQDVLMDTFDRIEAFARERIGRE